MLEFTKNELIVKSQNIDYGGDVTFFKTYILDDNDNFNPVLIAKMDNEKYIFFKKDNKYVFDYLYNHLNGFKIKRLDTLDLPPKTKEKILDEWDRIAKKSGKIIKPIFDLSEEEAVIIYKMSQKDPSLLLFLDKKFQKQETKIEAKTVETPSQETKKQKSETKGAIKQEKKKTTTFEDIKIFSEKEYDEYLEQKVKEINKDAKKDITKIRYDKNNKTEREIAKSIKAGKYPLLIGQSGISKTYSAEKIARENEIPLIVLRGTRDTDATHIVGMPIISKLSPFETSQTVKYKDGFLTKAIKKAQQGKVMFLIDEIGKIDDTTALISGISENSIGEIGITVNEAREFLLLKSKIHYKGKNAEGYFWVEVSNDKEANYEITENGVEFVLEEDEDLFKIVPDQNKNELGDIEKRAARGDLLKIYQGDVIEHKEILKALTKGIHEADKEFYAPIRNLIFVATGNNHEDSDSFDQALISRFDPKYIERPPIKTMIGLVIKKRLDNEQIEWDQEAVNKVTEIVADFIHNIESRFVDNADNFLNRRADFRTINSIIDSIDPYDPFDKESDGFILEALQDNIEKFIDAESVLAIRVEELKKSTSMDMAKKIAETVLEKHMEDTKKLFQEKEISRFLGEEESYPRMKM